MTKRKIWLLSAMLIIPIGMIWVIISVMFHIGNKDLQDRKERHEAVVYRSEVIPQGGLISFRSIPLDQPGVRDALVTRCLIDEPDKSRCEPLKNKAGDIKFVTEYGALKGEATIDLSEDGKLLAVTMYGTHDQMLKQGQLLTEKYGMPARNSAYQSSYYGSNCSLIEWRDKNGTAIYMNYGMDYKEKLGILHISTKVYRDKQIKTTATAGSELDKL